MIFNWRSNLVKHKYRFKVLKIGKYFKIEFCRFKKNWMLRFEFNNWDK